MSLPKYRQEAHYRRIVLLLIAGDVAAKYHCNTNQHLIEIGLIDRTKVIWSNPHENWVYTALDVDGSVVETGVAPFVSAEDDPEEVANTIATYRYYVESKEGE